MMILIKILWVYKNFWNICYFCFYKKFDWFYREVWVFRYRFYVINIKFVRGVVIELLFFDNYFINFLKWMDWKWVKCVFVVWLLLGFECVMDKFNSFWEEGCWGGW